MSTFSATANSSSTIGYAQYGSSSWSTGSSNGACQGAYKGTTAAKSRVGVMVFNNAGTTLKGKLIQQISLSITCSGAGSGSSSKVLTFHKANYQSLNTVQSETIQILSESVDQQDLNSEAQSTADEEQVTNID